ncbi:MAG: hypothetical protein V7784_07520 [Oceanospirillaceae bacterium]
MLAKAFQYLLLISLLVLLFIWFPINYNYSDFKDYLTVLLTVSSMVFTLMGIWIAFLYPDALNKIANIENDPNLHVLAKAQTVRVESLVKSVLKSAIVVTMIVFFYLLKIILINTVFYSDNIIYFKSIALSAIITLTILQLESVGYIVYSNVMFINDLHHKREEAEADQDI